MTRRRLRRPGLRPSRRRRCSDRATPSARRPRRRLATGRRPDRRRSSARDPCRRRKPSPVRGLPVPPWHRQEWLHLDTMRAITIDHSDNKQDTPRLEEDVRPPPVAWFLDHPDTAGGEALAGCCGRATSGPTPRPTTSPILGWALETPLPTPCSPNPDDQGPNRSWSVPTPSALPTRGVPGRGSGVRLRLPRRRPPARRGGFSGAHAIDSAAASATAPWVAEATHLLQISRWPARTRLILRKSHQASDRLGGLAAAASARWFHRLYAGIEYAGLPVRRLCLLVIMVRHTGIRPGCVRE